MNSDPDLVTDCRYLYHSLLRVSIRLVSLSMNVKPCMLAASGEPLPVCTCPTCGYVMDSATCIEDKVARPSSGDMSVCLKFGEILTFDETLAIQIPTLAQLMKLDSVTNNQLLRFQSHIRSTRPLDK